MKKLVKVIINGEEYFKEVESNDEPTTDAAGDNVAGDNASKTESKERKESKGINLDDLLNLKELKELKKLKEIKLDGLGQSIDAFGEKITNTINSAFSKINFQSKTTNSKTKRLLTMLPYMEDDDIHDAFIMALKDEEGFEDVDVSIFLPYLEDEDISLLLKYAIKNGDEKMIKAVYPYADDSDLDEIVDEYIAGNIANLDIDSIYPYLDGDTIKKLFYFELKKK